MSMPMGFNFQISAGVQDAFDTVSRQIVQIIDDVIVNGHNMRQHWTGTAAAEHFDQNASLWHDKAVEMDQAFGGVSQALRDIEENFRRNESEIASLYQV